jgi:hypothetical protein
MSTPDTPGTLLNEGISESKYIDLPSGKPLNSNEASQIIRRTGAPIVLLVGAVESGKTTLLASLHDSFQRSLSFANYISAGSSTLIGFEERCFDSRAESGAIEPSTLRTTFDEGLMFYHLELRVEDRTRGIHHLLIADMSGEFYERAMNSAAETKELTIITRADHFVHLLDGANLASKTLKDHTRANALLLMRRIFEQNMLRDNARVDVLITKWDIVLKRFGAEGAAGLLNEYRQIFQTKWGKHVGRLNVQSVAVRPHFTSDLRVGYGLSDVLARWLEEPQTQLQPVRKRIPMTTLSRTFDDFAVKEAPDLYEACN